MTDLIQLAPRGETQFIGNPLTRLGSGRFQEYLSASRRSGGKYAPALRAQLWARMNLGPAIQHLTDAGFEVQVTPELAPWVEAARTGAEGRAAEAAAALDEARGRLEASERALAARGLALYPYQRDGVLWLSTRQDGGLLGDQMGLGKTVQALLAAPEGAPVLVVAPAAVKGVWYAEARRWRPDLRPRVGVGRKGFRWPRAGEIFICNYDILPDGAPGTKGQAAVVNALGPAALPGTVVIADEAHLLKNYKAKRTKRFQAISEVVRAQDGRVWLLTGTPLLNRPDELWTVLQAAGIARDAWSSRAEFVRHFQGSQDRWGGWSWGTPSPDVVERIRRVSLVRRREQVLPDLPTKTYRTVEVPEIDSETRELADALVAKLADLGVDLAAAEDVAEVVNQSTTRVLFEEMSRVREALARAKTGDALALVEQYEEEEEPVVVFSAHRWPVDRLAEREGWAKITGSEDPARRTEIVRDFQEGRLRGLALTIRAGGIGLTLTRAAHAVFVDVEWTPALNAQAEDRICRIGQDRGCVITRLVAPHILDERMTELLAAKAGLIAASVDASAVTELPDLVAVKPIPEVRVGTEAPQASPEAPRVNGRRSASNPIEQWAGSGLLTLAGLDADHAAIQNGVGFNGTDTDFGHSLAKQLEAGGLTDKQWAIACRMLKKYHRQIGRAPQQPEGGA